MLEGVEAAREGLVHPEEIVADGPLPEPPVLSPFALPPRGAAGVARELPLKVPPPAGLVTTGGWPFGE